MWRPMSLVSKSVRRCFGTKPMSAQNFLNTGRTSPSDFRPYTKLKTGSLVNQVQGISEALDGGIRHIKDVTVNDIPEISR